ncbi:MAG: hypothetical protein HGB05_22430 [Chloroflexi bacterium]|nr:hypothetical protein [Chloroflexota bacterium]
MTPETPTSQTTAWLQRLNNWKLPIIVGGGFLGAAIGAAAARLFIRSDEIALERDRQRGPKGIGFAPSVMLPLAITLVGLIREIGGLAGQKQEK